MVLSIPAPFMVMFFFPSIDKLLETVRKPSSSGRIDPFSASINWDWIFFSLSACEKTDKEVSSSNEKIILYMFLNLP